MAMSDRTHGPVIVGIDGTEEAMRAALYGAWEAHRRRVPLRLVYADVPVGKFGAWLPLADKEHAWVREQFAIAEKLIAAGYPDLHAQTAIMSGSPAGALVAESKQASLVVVGTQATPGLVGHLSGSVAAQVATHAHAPVVVLRGARQGDPDAFHGWPVVVGVDGSPESEHAVAFAVEQAVARGTDVHAVYVWNILDVHDYGIAEERYVHADEAAKAQRLLTEATAGWADRYPQVTIVRHTEHGLHPVTELGRVAEGAGLIVVGSRGHGGFLGLRLGSTVDGLIRTAPVPVAVVREPYETPR
jgi:nucleotide-binding universal stress UspA family protein